jgi:hypothetical protein
LLRNKKGGLISRPLLLFCTALSAWCIRTFFIARATAAAGAQVIATSFHILMLLGDIWRGRLFLAYAARRGDESGQARRSLAFWRAKAFAGLLLVAEAAVEAVATLLAVAVLIRAVAPWLALFAWLATALIGLGLGLVREGRALNEGLRLAGWLGWLTLLGHKAGLREATLLRRIGLLARAIRLVLEALGRGGEAIGQAAQIIIIILIEFRPAFGAVIAHLRLLLRGLGGRDQAEIMFGMLEIALRHDGIARGLRVTGELEIFLSHMMGGAADFHIGAVGLIGPRERIRPLAVVATAHTLVLTWSH